jgi:pyrimidine operon attenuation protein/uracil phosphoribosyltransferase
MTEVVGARFQLYSESELTPVVARMARELQARVDSDRPLLLGMLRRGVPLANRLLAALSERAAAFERLDLLVKRYSDDLRLLHPETRLDAPLDADQQIRGRQVFVVDDVLYQGYSLFRVMEYLRTAGAAAIHAVVLADRCVACLPVHADVIGVRLQIAPSDVVECSVPPYEKRFAIDVLRPDRT